MSSARSKTHRAKAGELLQKLRDGHDPKAERSRAAVRDRTLRQWLEVYLAANKDLRERSREEYRRGVERHFAEAWLDRPLREISPDEVEKKHAALGKNVGPAAADAAMRALRAIWNFALDRDATMPANPVRVLKRKGWFKPPARTRCVRADELPVFWAALEKVPNQTAADYIRLLLFTGMRRREAAGLRWAEIDFSTKTIRLPPARTKADRTLALPMSAPVRDLLVRRRALGNDKGWVFPADSRSGHIEEPKFAFDQVAEICGVRVSAHDMRRTFATIAEAADISPLALKALLNHALPGGDVTTGYIQMTTERLRDPAQKVAEKFKELAGAAAQPEPDNVARLP